MFEPTNSFAERLAYFRVMQEPSETFSSPFIEESCRS